MAWLLQAFYGIRMERLLLEQLHDKLHSNLLFRRSLGLSPDDLIWHPTTLRQGGYAPGGADQE